MDLFTAQKHIAAYTLFPWEHRQALLRLVDPWQAAGINIQFGTQWDQVFLEPISSAGLVHIHRDFPRLGKAYYQVVERARNARIPVVYDLDEDLFDLPPNHPDRHFHYRSDALFPVLQAIVEADAVIVSTPALLEVIQPLNPDTRLLPDYLDDRLWSLKAPSAREKNSPFIVGWINDQVVEPDGFVEGIGRFLRKQGKNVLLRLWGAKPPPSLLDLANVDWLPELPQKYPRYVEELSRLDCDLMVVPHGDHLYFQSQSPQRFFEISACGIPGIFSRVLPYQDVITHQENGWLAETSDEWVGALDSLFHSDSSRQQAVDNAQKTIRSDWLLSSHAGGWLRLYEDLASQVVRSKGQKSLARQAADLAGQVRVWQRDLEEQIYQREWEVRALNVMMKRKEREASQYIDQLNAQLQSVWDSPTYRLLDKIRHPERLFSTSGRSRDLPATPPQSGQESHMAPGKSFTPDRLPRARSFDVILMAGEDWDINSDRNRRLVDSFLQQGSRVFCILPPASANGSVQSTEAGILAIPLPKIGNASSTIEPVETREAVILRGFFESLRRDEGIFDAICWVEDASWLDLVFTLRNWFGWKAVAAMDPGRLPQPVGQLFKARSDLYLSAVSEREQFFQLQKSISQLYPRISLIVLTYNNLNYTRQCLESIFTKTSYPNFEIVVVDNASTDGTLEFLRSFAEIHPQVKLLLNRENLGFAAGNNQGVEASTGEYLVFLNNDIVVTHGWLSRLVGHLRNPQAGAVGPVTNYAGNESRISVDYSDIVGLDDFARRYTHDHAGQTFEIRMLALFCLAVRRTVIDTVGLLDERFDVGMYEDDDFSLRIRQKGYTILCAEDVYIHHWGSAAFSQMAAERYQRLHEENRAKFEEKWGTRWRPHHRRMDES